MSCCLSNSAAATRAAENLPPLKTDDTIDQQPGAGAALNCTAAGPGTLFGVRLAGHIMGFSKVCPSAGTCCAEAQQLGATSFTFNPLAAHTPLDPNCRFFGKLEPMKEWNWNCTACVSFVANISAWSNARAGAAAPFLPLMRGNDAEIRTAVIGEVRADAVNPTALPDSQQHLHASAAPSPWQPSEKCQAVATAWCNTGAIPKLKGKSCFEYTKGPKNGRTCEGPMLARKGGALGTGPAEWRCYSPGT